MNRALSVAACALLTACGPSVATLVQTHHVEQAFCSASDRDEALLAVPALLAKVAPEWRVRRVLRDDLPGLDEALAKDIFGRFALAIVETRRRAPKLDVNELDFVASFTSATDRQVGLVSNPLSPAEFASITGESVPDAKQVTETKLAHPESAVPWALVTLGASLLFADRTTQTTTEYPTDAELRKAAPRSAALYDALLAKFGRAPIVAVQLGVGARRFEVVASLIIDNHTGTSMRECGSSLRVELRGESFALDPITAWPAGTAFRPFDTRAWHSADFEHGREFFNLRVK